MQDIEPVLPEQIALLTRIISTLAITQLTHLCVIENLRHRVGHEQQLSAVAADHEQKSFGDLDR